MPFFPRPPQLPSRPREVAVQVVKQEKFSTINLHVIVLEKKKIPPELRKRDI